MTSCEQQLHSLCTLARLYQGIACFAYASLQAVRKVVTGPTPESRTSLKNEPFRGSYHSGNNYKGISTLETSLSAILEVVLGLTWQSSLDLAGEQYSF